MTEVEEAQRQRAALEAELQECREVLRWSEDMSKSQRRELERLQVTFNLHRSWAGVRWAGFTCGDAKNMERERERGREGERERERSV